MSIAKIKTAATSIAQTIADVGAPAAVQSGHTPIAMPMPSGRISRSSSNTSATIASLLATRSP